MGSTKKTTVTTTYNGTFSKGYTINYFIKLIQGLPARQLELSVYRAVAPKKGYASTKAKALNTLLGNEADYIAQDNLNFFTRGRTAKSRLLNALRVRKQR